MRAQALTLVAISVGLGLALAGGAVANARAGSTTLEHGILARSATAETDVSSNWSGYSVAAPSTTYTSVTGTWKQPKATCTGGSATSSAFWVGLGGYSASSQALEQTGTEADCDENGTASYSAWYEIVPENSVQVKLKIDAGDTITTSVNVLDGTTIEMQIKDRTKRTSFTKKLTYATPDLSSAEWIAEAPSLCDARSCSTQALTNFGSISFTKAAAIGNAVGGTLTNPSWTATPIQLVADGRRGFFPGPDRFDGSSGSTAGANPGALSTDGRSFPVAWAATSST